ncbi:MotA/TolQ/ExbB proton channel family protein [Anaerovorax odorimutans]|uniref:MotA/TolQ/ExbB proton channel family protein n=1 Tax=Anaerovorax odorimutans TaxID=109327 RepID=UPI00042A070E|nr:MotA/TolQ/ExbB proton channel family protein [Anaerovorax odorimutans]
MGFSSSISNAIHIISSSLKIPAIIILLIFVVVVVFELGSLAVEIIFERRKEKTKVSKILNEIQNKKINQIQEIIRGSNLLKRQRLALDELLQNNQLSPSSGQTLARRILSTEDLQYQKTIYRTDVIVRLGPMFGLMATLIPLGPGLLALGQGDTKTLADSLLTAFDATVAGLATAGVAFIISKLRKRWYEDDMISTEAIMEGILEEMYGNESRIKEQQ